MKRMQATKQQTLGGLWAEVARREAAIVKSFKETSALALLALPTIHCSPSGT